MGDTEPSPASSHDIVSASLYFLARLPLYDTVKPFVFLYDPKNGFPVTNIENELHSVQIRDMRKFKTSYEQCGFQLGTMASTLAYEDYQKEELIKTIHIPEVESYLKTLFGASTVHVINYSQRKRHADFPVATGKSYEFPQPATRVHMDVSLATCKATVHRVLGSSARNILAGRWQYVNIWHPIQGPLQDWPLAICDASTLDFAADTMTADLVGTDAVDEEVEVHHNPHHQWYYLSGQLPSELLVFKCLDPEFENGGSFGTPHTSFQLEPTSSITKPRESIEMRAIIAW